MMFTEEQIKQLQDEFLKLNLSYEEILLKFNSWPLNNGEAREYALHGFTRRMKTLKRCIENIYSICPPDKPNKPTRDELTDLVINLQSFVFNVFGCIDNLAWIWVKETGFEYKRNTDVGFSNKKIKEELSDEFKNYLSGERHKKWLSNLIDFRHALAHRIPLYVPPYTVLKEKHEAFKRLGEQMDSASQTLNPELYEKLDIEQEKLGTFIPVMTHSFTEGAPTIIFHSQILADWNTLVEMADKFVRELESKKI